MAALPRTSNEEDEVSHYISTTEQDRHAMLDAIGAQNIAQLFDVVPQDVRFPHVDLALP